MSTIKVMAFEPNRPSTVMSLPNELEDLQDYVGGLLIPINMGYDLRLFCNEDGIPRRLKPNRDIAIVDSLGRHYADTILGNFFICKVVNEAMMSIDSSDVARIKRWEQDGTLTMYRAHS